MHAFTGSLVWVEQNVDLSLEHRASCEKSNCYRLIANEKINWGAPIYMILSINNKDRLASCNTISMRIVFGSRLLWLWQYLL